MNSVSLPAVFLFLVCQKEETRAQKGIFTNTGTKLLLLRRCLSCLLLTFSWPPSKLNFCERPTAKQSKQKAHGCLGRPYCAGLALISRPATPSTFPEAPSGSAARYKITPAAGGACWCHPVPPHACTYSRGHLPSAGSPISLPPPAAER